MNYDDFYTDFANHVSCDGYKKLRNIEPKDRASCICVGPCLLLYTFDAHRSGVRTVRTNERPKIFGLGHSSIWIFSILFK